MAEENGRFGKRTRYSVKESYAQDAKGIIHNSINELNPNVVRIEPLGPAARQAFLGPVHAAADALKLRMAYAMNPEAFKPFYGILTPGDLRGLRLSFQSSWLQENGKSSFERATEILKSPAVAMPLGASAGEAIGNSFGGYDASGFGLGAAAGAITSFIMSGNSNDKDNGNSLTHKLSSFIGDVGTRLGSSMELYGMDSSSTGASTLKTFSKSSMEIPTTLTFTWYMPEQEDLFRLSIHRLLQLAYVRKAYTDRKEFFENLSAATNSGMQQSFVNAKNLKDSLGSVAKAWIDAGNTIVESGESLVGQSPAMKQFAESRNAQLSDAVVDAAGTGVSVGNAIANGITSFTEGWGDKIDANASLPIQASRISSME